MFERDQDAFLYGVTPVENKFLLEYMPAARGDYVKVYLWGLMQSGRDVEGYGLEEMAQTLFLTPAEVEAALRYWERRGLVSRMRQEPPLYRFYSPIQRDAMRKEAPLQVDDAYVTFEESVYAAFGDRRKVTNAEIILAWEWVQDIGLKPEVVLMLLNHCIAQRGVQFSFKRAEPLAVRMKEENVITLEDADVFLRHDQAVHEGVRKVLARMGKRRAASEDEIALYEKWIGEWGFAPDAVLDACRETTKGDPSFKYLDGILSGIRSRSGARTEKQVRRQLDEEGQDLRLAKEVFSGLASLNPETAIRLYRQFAQMYPHAVLMLAADECRRKKGRRIEDLQALLLSWQGRGLKTEEDVKEFLAFYREANLALKEIFEVCGQAGQPAEGDRALYRKWREWDMDRQLLLHAAEQARAAQGSKTAYLDKVLEAWHEAGIRDISQAKARPAAKSPGRGKQVSAQMYGQRDYTEDELNAVSGDLIEEAKNYHG